MNIDTGRRRRWIVIACTALAAVLLVVLALRQVQRVGGGHRVWVASAGLVPGATVGPEDIRQARVRNTESLAGVIRNREQIQGRQLTRRKQEGAPFTDGDFQEVQRNNGLPSLSASIPEGRVLFPLRSTPFLFRSQQLRRGDRIDILAAGRRGEARIVARDVFLMGQNRNDRVSAPADRRTGPFGIDLGGEAPTPPPLYMYLAIHPEDALPLSEAQASGSSLRLVMHSNQDVTAGRVTDLDGNRGQVVELIRGAGREDVPVAY